jgi:hypothetical protein
MRLKLLTRLSAVDGVPMAIQAPRAIQVTGPALHCATVEDAERLAQRLSSWLLIFRDLGEESILPEDRAAFTTLDEMWRDVVVDLERAIRATRIEGVPWEETGDRPRGVVSAREISGSGTIDPRIAVRTGRKP